LLAIVAITRWAAPQDEHAYWLAGQRLLAGQPLYDPTATAVTPFAYWYPPPLAQLAAPVSALLPSAAFSWLWTALLLGCVLLLARGRPLIALAIVAFVPVAVELWFRNVHLLLAAILALGILRWPWLFSIGAIIKLAPGLGLVYLMVRGRWRDLAVAVAVGGVVVLVSVALGPGLWGQFVDTVQARGPNDVSSIVPLPYVFRAGAGLVLAVVAGRIQPRLGEPLLIVAVVVASPTLWVDALSMLAAIAPVVAVRREAGTAAERSAAATPTRVDRAGPAIPGDA
jgi:hypothetical protein